MTPKDVHELVIYCGGEWFDVRELRHPRPGDGEWGWAALQYDPYRASVDVWQNDIVRPAHLLPPTYGTHYDLLSDAYVLAQPRGAAECITTVVDRNKTSYVVSQPFLTYILSVTIDYFRAINEPTSTRAAIERLTSLLVDRVREGRDLLPHYYPTRRFV